ncbi:hypothetical protein [Mycobacterium sp. NPDC006124]|uniref:hypothetical protein n=1 Tax=Mycobacterium sp. NPDC006124 TaxID=3156729 RepID=UPI00339F72A5
MSWLLVVFIPALLMLATFGLDRLEAGLDDDTVSPADVTASLERAKAVCAKPAARTRAVDSYELLDDGYDDVCRESVFTRSARDLPTRVIIPHESNTEFRPTRHAFRV